MINVFVIDDSAIVRETLSRVLETDAEIKVVGVAADPIIAMKKLQTITPDVITLDIEMPRMDGITFLRELMKTKPIPVVICSSMAESGSHNALKALEYGAVDLIQKPNVGTKQFIEESRILICDAIKAAFAGGTKKCITGSLNRKLGNLSVNASVNKPAKSISVAEKQSSDSVSEVPAKQEAIETTEKVVVVGASTGGTEALKTFLTGLPLNSPGMVIVQHMPEHFTSSFAKRLDSLCKVHVKEAANNDSVIRGTVLIAPGNKHTLLKRSGSRYFVEVKEGPLVSRHRPSVDVLFSSTARYAGKNAIGVIMTGMGDDGSRGMLEMHNAGAYTIAQNEETCVVFGMPQKAIKAGAVDNTLPLDLIAEDVIRAAGLSR